MFHVTIDPRRPLLRTRLSGFWSVDTVDHYMSERARAVAMLVARGQRFGVVSDARAFVVQSAEVAARFVERRIPPPPLLVGTAVVVPTVLSKFQARRALGEGPEMFLDPDEAETWIAARIADRHVDVSMCRQVG